MTVALLEVPAPYGDVANWAETLGPDAFDTALAQALTDLEPIPAPTPPATVPPDLEADPDVDPRTFFEKSRLVVERLGDAVNNRARIELGYDTRLYRYENGVYLPDGEIYVRQTVRRLLGPTWTSGNADQVIAWFRARFPYIIEKPDTRYLNVANGLLDLQTSELRPHTPDLPTSIQLPVNWNPDAACPTIDRFLAEVVPADSIGLVLELIGYTLYPRSIFRKAIMLLGPGRNGKSKLLATIVALVGKQNAATVPLQTLAEDRFSAAQLFGKLANICGDIDARAIKRTDTFKQVTGDDPIFAQRKYGHPFDFTSFATPWFSANEAPISSDQTDAWFDRWVIIPFERRFTEEEQDPHLEAKLTTPAELEGLLVRAVGALRALMIRGRFETPETVRDAGRVYRQRLDSVQGFVEEICSLDSSLAIEKTELYRIYKEWAHESGRFALSAVTFNDHLKRAFGEGISEKKTSGKRLWTGIGRAGDYDEEDTEVF